MLPPNTFAIRPAVEFDTAALRWLAELDSQRPLTGSVIVGYDGGVLVAAMSLDDGRVIADPFRPTAHLVTHLRMRAGVQQAHLATPSLRERMRTAVAPFTARTAADAA